MPRFPIPLVGGSSKSVSTSLDSQRCINLYPEILDSGLGKAKIALVNTPGLTLCGSSTTITGPQRPGGMITIQRGSLNPAIYGIAGTDFFTYTGSSLITSTIASLGSLITSGGPVSMVDNGTVMLVVDGSYYYKWISTFAQYTDAALTTGAEFCAYLDGFIIINDKGTYKFRVSPLNWNGTDAWSSLAFGEANQNPEPINGIKVVGRDVFVFKKNGFEVWYNAGLATFPLARNQSVSSQIGLYAKSSLTIMNDSLFWLGGGKEGYGKVYMMQGYNPVKVSNSALENEIVSYARSDDAIGMAYHEGAHSFYVLTFPSEGKTHVYDSLTGYWHERLYRNPVTCLFECWKPYAMTTLGIKVFIGDDVFENHMLAGDSNFSDLTYRLYLVDPESYTDNGDTIVRIRTSPHIFDSQTLNRMFFRRLQTDIETGVGLTTGQGSDPTLMMRYSDDGGKTWSNNRYTSFGKIGEYSKRAIFNRLGSGRDRVWELSVSDPVPVRISGAYVDAEVGTM